MRWWTWLLLISASLGIALTAAALSIRRSRQTLLQLARLIPTCLALFRDIMRDPDVPRRAKIAPAVAIAYLVIPIDLIPDFIPGIGYLDDALIVAWAMRHLIAAAGRDRVTQHWTGDPHTLERILQLARVPPTGPPPTGS